MPKVEATYLQPNPVQETVSVQAPEPPPESDIDEAPSEDEIPVDESDDEIETDDELQEMEAEPATELRGRRHLRNAGAAAQQKTHAGRR
jgi:hypothetical protein